MNTGASIRWSPHSTADNQRFLKINSRDHELNLYNISQEKGKGTRCKLVSKHSKIPQIRCFDWSPVQEDLVSVGQSSGEALLIKLSNNTPIRLPVKHERSCNSISFNCTGKLVATALDKVRNDFCLNIWDINQRLSSSGSEAVRPARQLASSEAVHSVRFFREHPDVLVCGVNYRWIKSYDLRDSPVNPTFSLPSRCSQGISLDLDSNYFASHSDDNLIAVWDRRCLRGVTTTNDSPWALMFNRPTDEHGRAGGQIVSLRYSNTKAGTFAVLNTAGGLRIYETGKISDPEPQHVSSLGLFAPTGTTTPGAPEFNKSRKGWRESASSLLDGTRMNGGSSGSRTPNPRQDPGETLFVTRISDAIAPSRLAKNDRRVVSFDWICSGAPNCGDPLRTICLRADGTPNVITCSGSATSLAFGSRNGLLITAGKNLNIIPSPPTSLEVKLSDVRETAKHPDSSPSSPVGSLNVRLGMHEGHRPGRSNSVVRPEDFLYDANDILCNDMCVVMRRRVEGGYEMDCTKNIELVREQYLKDLWQWLAGATEAAADNGMVAGLVDMSYMGVLGIWNSGTGFPPGQESVSSRLTHGRWPKAEDWTTAIAEINKRARREDFKGRTNYPEQRQLALAICGWDFGTSELENELCKLEENKEYAKAAGWAMFHGEIKRCIQTLSNGGQQMKVMSTAVAGYYSHAQMAMSSPHLGETASTETAKNANIWKELCREMAVELDEPYLRAVFAYVSNGEWREVLDELGLPIRERLLIALRWLGDDELTEYLEGLTAQVIEDGDVDGIVLTGISGKAMDLLQVYVNRKGDVQTASLVAGFAVPRYFEDERVGYWVESYRQLLNSWRLFHARAKFDVARGKMSRNHSGSMTINDVQRQVYVRCTYCDRSISHGASHSSAAKPTGSKPNMNPREKTSTTAVPLGTNSSTKVNPTFQSLAAPHQPEGLRAHGADPSRTFTKATVCPQCKKSLPRCAVCLLNLGTKYYKKSVEGALGNKGSDDGKATEPENDYDRWFNFCLSCNHGMHSGHAREWFAKHKICPVPDCACRCKM